MGEGQFLLTVFDPKELEAQTQSEDEIFIPRVCDILDEIDPADKIDGGVEDDRKDSIGSFAQVETQLSSINTSDTSSSSVSQNCTDYQWSRSLIEEGQLISQESVGVADTLGQGLLPEGEYEYTYQRCRSGICSAITSPLIIQVQKPIPPVKLAASYNAALSINLTWQKDPSAKDSIIEESVNGSAWQKVYSGTKQSLTVSAGFGRYRYRVKNCSYGACNDYVNFKEIIINKPVSAGKIVELDYQLFKDSKGNFYLKAPNEFVLIASDISIPLFVESRLPVLMLSKLQNKWNISEIALDYFKVQKAQAVTDYQLKYVDQDGNKNKELIVSLGQGREFSHLVISDINSSAHAVAEYDAAVLSDNPEADVRPTKVQNPLDDTDRGEVVGSIPAEFKVTSMGTANYNMPIEQAPGTAGLVPNLSLDYSSSSGNGWLGVGWSIGGISVITRCPQNKEQDGQASGISFTDTDRFCLDGKKLFVKNGGQYGSSYSKYRLETHEPLDIEIIETNQFGATKFTVNNIDGSQLIYKGVNVTSSRGAVAWPLWKKVDAAGNEIVYQYTNSNVNSLSYRLSSVIYANGLNSIEFDYEDREDIKQGYSAGYRFSIDKRLTTITSYVNNQELRTYHFDYVYGAATKRSLISSIQASRGDSYLPKTQFDWAEGDVSFASEVKYSNNNNDSYKDNRISSPLPYLLLDMNGDGIQDYWKLRDDSNSSSDDIIFIKGGATFKQTAYFEDDAKADFRFTAKVIDVDNDGRDDVIFRQAGYWQIYRSHLDVNDPYAIDYKIGTGAINTNIRSQGDHIKIADFNSDGYADFAYQVGDKLIVHFNEFKTQGFGRFSAAQQWTIPGVASARNAFPYFFHDDYFLKNYIKVLDIDADGINDFLFGIPEHDFKTVNITPWGPRTGPFGGRWKLFNLKNNQLSFVETIEYFNTPKNLYTIAQGASGISYGDVSAYGNGIITNSLTVEDLNGDGLADLTYLKIHIENPRTYIDEGEVYVRFNKGNGEFTDEQHWLIVNVDDEGLPNFHLADINGDGYTDFLIKKNGYYYVHYFDGEGLSAPVKTSIPSYTGMIDQFVDLDGDDNADYLHLNGRLSNFRSTSGLRDVITNITDGYENEKVITYTSLTSSAALTKYTREVDGYTKNWGNGSLVVDVNQPYKVVTKVTFKAGSSESTSSYVNYFYRGLKAQFGRGMLGFAEVSNYESDTKTKRVATYHQDFPYTGLLKSTKTYVDSKLINETKKNYKRYLNTGYVYSSLEETFQYDLATTDALSYTQLKNELPDAWGNFGKVTTLTKPSASSSTWYKSTVNNTYEHADSFLGGRLTHQTITKSRSSEAQSISTRQHFGYDSLGLLEFTETDGSQGSGSAPDDELSVNFYLKEAYTRDKFGNLVFVKTTGDGIKTRAIEYQFDTYGRYATKEIVYRGFPTDDYALTTQYTYHSVLGAKTSTRSPNGQTDYYGYSQLGRLNFEYRADGTFSSIDLQKCTNTCVDGAWYYQTQTESHGGDSVVYFGSKGRELANKTQVIESYNGSGVTQSWLWTRHAYNREGQGIGTSIPHFSDLGLTQLRETTFQYLPQGYAGVQYDAVGRKVAAKDAKGNSWAIEYDGRTVKETDPDGRVQSKTTNVIGELVESTDVDGNSLSYKYDAAGNLTHVIRSHSAHSGGSGNIITRNYYDHLGRKVKMSDPDKGIIQYKYDAVGNIIWQQDNKSQVTTQEFDALDRIIVRQRRFANSVLDQDTQWIYDTRAYGKGLVSRVSDKVNNITQDYHYHWLSKVNQRSLTFNTGSSTDRYTERTLFYGPENAYAVKTEIDATGYGIKNTYTDFTLVKRHNLKYNKLLWQFGKADAWGNTTEYQLGNKLLTEQEYDEYTGHLTSIKTGQSGGVQNLSYHFDKYGDLEYRYDNLNNIDESFVYDDLHRLTDITLSNGGGTQRYAIRYDELGNIISKTDVGTYHYESGRPHAVSRISNGDLAGSFSYDANGNMTSGGGRSLVEYNTVDKPTLIRAGSQTTEFEYGFDGVRFKRLDKNGSSVKQTLYVGNVEFTRTNGVMSLVQRHLAGVAVEMEYFGANSRQVLSYLYRDHLGSVTVMTDANGKVVSEHSFDVWGQRRALQVGSDNPLKPLNRAMDFAHADYNRGFTGHEHIDELGIIHMNGRVYDPRLARFLSVDPLVADGTNLQAYNRYSYVRNNPLNAVDPSGYSVVAILAQVVAILVAADMVYEAVAIAYYIYMIYQAVETVYNSVQAFKYGDGGPGAIANAAMAAYSVYGSMKGISDTGADSSTKGAGAEGNQVNQAKGQTDGRTNTYGGAVQRNTAGSVTGPAPTLAQFQNKSDLMGSWGGDLPMNTLVHEADYWMGAADWDFMAQVKYNIALAQHNLVTAAGITPKTYFTVVNTISMAGGVGVIAKAATKKVVAKKGPVLSDEAWYKNAPTQVKPGTKFLTHTKFNPNTKKLEYSEVKYDQYGRQIKRTDYTDHGYGDISKPKEYHSNPHSHSYEYGPKFGPKGKQTRLNQ